MNTKYSLTLDKFWTEVQVQGEKKKKKKKTDSRSLQEKIEL